MSRSTKPAKPYIVVFCEGESEQAYTDFLRKEFKDVASIHRPKATGLFDVADNKYKKDAKYRDYAEVTDEVWFFFDVETKDIGAWESRLKIIKRLRSLRKDPNIKVRLLMTTGCIEYWLRFSAFSTFDFPQSFSPTNMLKLSSGIVASTIERKFFIRISLIIAR